jgi:hypothetical protein
MFAYWRDCHRILLVPRIVNAATAAFSRYVEQVNCTPRLATGAVNIAEARGRLGYARVSINEALMKIAGHVAGNRTLKL